MQTNPAAQRNTSPSRARALFERVRRETESLCRTLAPEDCVVQSMSDVSPTKWHLAHTSWFFEQFVLAPHATDYAEFDSHYGYLFNSYYYSVGEMHRRPNRGLLTRPTVDEIYAYREHVTAHMLALLDSSDDPDLESLVTLGCHHEQQHQELILADIKHVLWQNPLLPAYAQLPEPARIITAPAHFIKGETGVHAIGHQGDSFAFDNETPQHDALLHPNALANRPVTNGEFREFINDGGYATVAHWLSDGWATVESEQWQRPLYWLEDLSREFTLSGVREIDPNAPICHLSYFEADAFARWAGARLPREAEWESAASTAAIAGNFVESGYLHPVSSAEGGDGFRQFFGDVWEWTQTSYSAYPGFKPLGGSLGEYNGKFMCGQFVLRGGSCATPVSHIRPTYRNFFYPHQRWQFTGLRLARDL